MPGQCYRCKEFVHAAEERLALDKSWHLECFTCAICNKALDSRILYECRVYNEIYCRNCYRKHFAIQGYGYGVTDPTLISLESCQEKAEKCYCADCTCDRPSTSPPKETFIPPPSRKGTEFLPFRIPPRHYQHQAKVIPRKCEQKCEDAHRAPNGHLVGCLCYRDEHGHSTVGECVNTRQHPVTCPCPAQRPVPRERPKTAPGCTCGFGKNRNDYANRTHPRSIHGVPCKRCGREVFYAEKVHGYRGVYHTRCFNCYRCNKTLDSTTVNEHQGELFCKGCYKHLYATTGVGYGVGAGTLQTP